MWVPAPKGDSCVLNLYVHYGVVREHLDGILHTAGTGFMSVIRHARLNLAPGPDTPGPAPPQFDHTAATR